MSVEFNVKHVALMDQLSTAMREIAEERGTEVEIEEVEGKPASRTLTKLSREQVMELLFSGFERIGIPVTGEPIPE